MIVIYHSRDLDGYCSGAICKKKYPEAKLIGYDYGQAIPYDELSPGEPIIMVDVSLPMDEMGKLAEYTNWHFTWIDHHASAIKDFEDYKSKKVTIWPSILEDGISACEGAWKYLFPNEEIPLAVKLLGEYDTWRNQDNVRWENEILPFQYGMRLDIKSAEDFPQLLFQKSGNTLLSETKLRGKTIFEYQRSQNEIAMRGSFDFEFEGLRILACNGGGFNSQAFESKWDEEKYDAMMPFKYDGKKWIFSLYTTKDIDLSIIAKKYGGGGHKKACGFTLTTEQLVNNMPQIFGFQNAF